MVEAECHVTVTRLRGVPVDSDLVARTWMTVGDAAAGSLGLGFGTGYTKCNCAADDNVARVRSLAFRPGGTLWATGGVRSMPAGDEGPLYGVAVWSGANGGAWSTPTWGTEHPVGLIPAHATSDDFISAAAFCGDQLLLMGKLKNAADNVAGPLATPWRSKNIAVYRTRVAGTAASGCQLGPGHGPWRARCSGRSRLWRAWPAAAAGNGGVQLGRGPRVPRSHEPAASALPRALTSRGCACVCMRVVRVCCVWANENVVCVCGHGTVRR
jgi:hypothetical protein